MAPDQIKALRASLAQTQAVFAETVGVALVTVQAWEQGRARPSRMAQDRLEQIQRFAIRAAGVES